MKTVGEFKRAGLVFVEGDERSSIHKGHGNVQMTNEMAFGTNIDTKTDCETVISFAWRENTGVKPEFVGQIEWVGDSDFVYVNRSDELIWSGKCIAKWRPSQNQHKKWPEKSRMDIIGQNGNDGLHYDNTAQQVEALAANNTLLQPRNPDPIFRTNEDAQKSLNEHLAKLAESKPIFTQAMVDVSVGFKLKFTHEIDGKFKHLHSERYGWEDGDDLEVIHITENHNGETCFIVLNCQPDVLNTAAIVDISFFDTRTPKQKAIDAALHEWPVADKATLEMAYGFWGLTKYDK